MALLKELQLLEEGRAGHYHLTSQVMPLARAAQLANDLVRLAKPAMEAAARNQFDLLISDIALPDGNGTELIACLRAMKPIRGIAISGFGMKVDIERSLEAGFSAHLVKPIKVEKLEAAIDRVMNDAL